MQLQERTTDILVDDGIGIANDRIDGYEPGVQIAMDQLVEGGRNRGREGAMVQHCHTGCNDDRPERRLGCSCDRNAVARDQQILCSPINENGRVAILNIEGTLIGANVGDGRFELDRERLVGLCV